MLGIQVSPNPPIYYNEKYIKSQRRGVLPVGPGLDLWKIWKLHCLKLKKGKFKQGPVMILVRAASDAGLRSWSIGSPGVLYLGS